MPPGKKQHKIQSFVRSEITYKVGDCVLVRGEASLPYIGKVKEIHQSEKGVDVKVMWFYRPEEAVGGRKPFHGERELFKSDHFDDVHANTIEGKCSVHQLKHYQNLKEVSDVDYFQRYEYRPTGHEFKPDRVPVYCVCEMPYNPDRFMVMCEQCEEWYHPKCLGFDDRDFQQPRPWKCHECHSKRPKLLD